MKMEISRAERTFTSHYREQKASEWWEREVVFPTSSSTILGDGGYREEYMTGGKLVQRKEVWETQPQIHAHS